MENTINKVIELICLAKENQINQEQLNRKSSIITDAGLDSIQLINFILSVEDAYGFEVDFDSFNYELLESIENFCEFINTQINGA